MDEHEHKFTGLETQLFNLLCLRAGEKFSQREAANILKVSPTAVSKSIPALVAAQLITLEKTTIMHYISLNTGSKRTIQLKRVQNLKLLYETGFSEFISEKCAGSTIILFGSFSRGEDTDTSDIDIAIVGRNKKELILDEFEQAFFRKININFYNSWNDIHIHLRNNILNGIVLHGSIEL